MASYFVLINGVREKQSQLSELKINKYIRIDHTKVKVNNQTGYKDLRGEATSSDQTSSSKDSHLN